MSEPAKDEAELIALIADVLSSNSLGFTHHGQAVRAIAAIRAAGWAVVPAEPTGEMFEAGHEEFWEGKGIVDTYRAMLAAAPGVKL